MAPTQAPCGMRAPLRWRLWARCTGANEDGRALPVLLLAPVAASGEPLVPLCPALQPRLSVLCISPARRDSIRECWGSHTRSRQILALRHAAIANFQPAPMACTTERQVMDQKWCPA